VLMCATQPSEEDVCGVLTQGLILAGRRWRARLNERLKAIGQTDARCGALSEIARAPDGIVQRDLAERLGVEEPTIVRLVDALKVLLITPAAIPVLQQAREIVLALEQELFDEMDPHDLAMCVGVLTRLSGKLGRA